MKPHPLRQAALCAALAVLAMCAPAAADRALSPEKIARLRASLKMDPATRALYNAITNNDVRELAVNRDVLRQHHPVFSHKIKTKGVTNQKSSGRCWLFAGLNVMRPAVMEKYKLEKFELSKNYLAFWDKLEKANWFLEQMIEFRDRDPLDREFEWLLEHPYSEGGWWEYVVDLVDKYGAVPKEVMQETRSSENSRLMHQLIRRKLKVDALKLRKMAAEGKPVEALREAKEKMLTEVYRMLVMNLGEPPTEFEWRYEDKEGKLSPRKTYTPQTFYKEFVGVDLAQYVNLCHDPTQPRGRRYRLRLSGNMVGRDDVTYANVQIDVLKQTAMKSVIDGGPVWFAADVSKDQDSKDGVMHLGIYDYGSIYSTDLRLTKAERLLYREGTSNHAMVFLGVDVKDDRPVKWLVENSWGKEKGREGFWTLYDSWFDEHVYCVIVKKAYVPNNVLEISKQEPVALPPWYPMAALVR